jgi:hypothetical protein
MIVAAEAKLLRYDIGGHTYTYDPRDWQDAQLARERIAAAKVAEDAKGRATAEATANPMVRVFGSPSQTEARQAEIALKRSLSTNAPSEGSSFGERRPMSQDVRGAEHGKRKGARNAPDFAVPTQQLRSHVGAQPITAPPQEQSQATQERPGRSDPLQAVKMAEEKLRSQQSRAMEADARLNTIERAASLALAEEQHRLEAERRRDRFYPGVSLRSSEASISAVPTLISPALSETVQRGGDRDMIPGQPSVAAPHSADKAFWQMSIVEREEPALQPRSEPAHIPQHSPTPSTSPWRKFCRGMFFGVLCK